MQSLIDQRPRTIMEVFKGLPEGTLAEVIENALYMSPAPSTQHQKLIGELFTDLKLFCRETHQGEVFVSPTDVYLDESSNAVQPDIVFFFAHNPIKVLTNGLHGTPNFIIEISSPGNSAHDRVRKKDLYEKFGVDEYWIVNSETRIAVGYSLLQNKFAMLGEFKNHIQSALLNRRFDF